MTRRATSRQMRMVDILALADRALVTGVSPVAEEHGITLEQWRVLVVLNNGNGRSMREIAVRAGLSAPTATRMVDRLVTDGFAYRRSDQWDRRRVLVHISRQGTRILERVADALDAEFGPLDAGDVDVVELLSRVAGSSHELAEDTPAS